MENNLTSFAWCFLPTPYVSELLLKSQEYSKELTRIASLNDLLGTSFTSLALLVISQIAVCRSGVFPAQVTY